MNKFECKLPPFKIKKCLSVQEAEQKAGWNITAFSLPKVWEKTQGEGVVIAVIDTGADLDHPDLVDNLLPGMNFVKKGKPPQDKNGHGSHVAGIMVAQNNDIGIVGVCPKAKVVPIKALDDDGAGDMKNVAKAIYWAVEQKVDFIVMSLGCPFKIQQVRKAIQAAAAKNIITFCAAGNAGFTKELYYPSAYPETLAIGAIDKDWKRAKFSNTGHGLDFMAPGVDILSTIPDNWYGVMSGTSQAAPSVAGIAALLLSYVRNKKVDLKLEKIEDYKAIFKKYTTPVKNGNYTDKEFYEGYGIIDPNKWLEGTAGH